MKAHEIFAPLTVGHYLWLCLLGIRCVKHGHDLQAFSVPLLAPEGWEPVYCLRCNDTTLRPAPSPVKKGGK